MDYDPSTEMVVLPGDAGDPYWNASCADCAGIVNGTAVLDSCGICHQAYIYNFITHTVTFVDDANTLTPGMDYDPSTEMVVLPDDLSNPYWNDCDSTNTPTISIIDIESRNLVKIVDVLGKEVEYQYNKILFFLFDDGTIEKKYILK